MNLVYDRPELVADWVGSLIPHVGQTGFGPAYAIGVCRKDTLIAGMVYHEYHPDAGTMQISMAAASPMWARRHIIRALLAYPFEQAGCFKVWTCTPIDNVKALKVNEHVGFRREATLAHHFGKGRHAVICRLLQPDFDRIYGDRHGKR